MNILLKTCGFFMLLLMATCNGTSSEEQKNQLTGSIEETGITSYQYGTHMLTTENKFYALKSDVVDLNQYIGETVTIEYKTIEGYPVDGGPEYLEVIGVE